jgi:hypothetical protein
LADLPVLAGLSTVFLFSLSFLQFGMMLHFDQKISDGNERALYARLPESDIAFLFVHESPPSRLV